jgi:hypothetical protein
MAGIVEIALVGIATVTVKLNGTGLAQERGRKQIFVVKPRQDGEPVWRVVQRVAEVIARSDEIGG